MKVKITIDKNKCLKCGLCTSIQPDVFKFNENGTEIVYKEEIDNLDDKMLDDLKMAEKNCPNGAIKIEEI